MTKGTFRQKPELRSRLWMVSCTSPGWRLYWVLQEFLKNLEVSVVNGKFSPTHKAEIKEGIRKKYAQVAAAPEGRFRYPTGRNGLQGLNYAPDILSDLPEEVLNWYCGVGNPFSLGPLHPGESVLDIGCGAGVDTLIAARLVGPSGSVVGIDLTEEMLGRALLNLGKTSLPKVSFQRASGEDLPFSDETFDAVISNGAFNLIPDKLRAIRETFRVLRPGGRLMIADQVLTGKAPRDTGEMVKNWPG
jgi:arsenite methyltransferase